MSLPFSLMNLKQDAKYYLIGRFFVDNVKGRGSGFKHCLRVKCENLSLNPMSLESRVQKIRQIILYKNVINLLL
jgi:hypothetical protein